MLISGKTEVRLGKYGYMILVQVNPPLILPEGRIQRPTEGLVSWASYSVVRWKNRPISLGSAAGLGPGLNGDDMKDLQSRTFYRQNWNKSLQYGSGRLHEVGQTDTRDVVFLQERAVREGEDHRCTLDRSTY